MAAFPLNFSLNPKSCDIDSPSFLSDMESERSSKNEMTEELFELKAQLELVNEDRNRLKKVVQDLHNERYLNLNRLVSSYIKRVPTESIYKETLSKEIEKLRKECEENDKILNTLKEVLGHNQFEVAIKENMTKGLSPCQRTRVNRSNSKLPMPSRSLASNRSVSPSQKLTLSTSIFN